MQARRYTVVATSFGSLYITEQAGRVIQIGLKKPSVAGGMRCDTVPLLRLAAEEIHAYLSGGRDGFTFARDTAFSPFADTVFGQVAQIPYGHTVTANELAQAIGQPRSARAVETLCRCNPLWIAIPCHRVLLTTDTAQPSRPLDAAGTLRRMETRYSS